MKKNFLLFFLIGVSIVSYGQTTITMQKENGVYVVPCTINGLKLKFIFDTGASDVSISSTEALFMLKNGYMSKDDVLDKQYYTDANGGISAGTRIIIRKIEFAGLTLNDVQASVVSNLEAPLLLGQSAISRLGKIQIDPSNNTLTILNGSMTSYNYGDPKIYSGTITVYTFSPILEKPEKDAKKIGVAADNKVTIIRKENNDFYYVTSGGIKGYLDVSWIAEGTWLAK